MSEPYLGEIAIFAFGKSPVGYLPADGRALNINQYQTLYALLGTRYGGDGKTTFCLPNLIQANIMGANPADPDFTLGKQGGSPTATLTANTLPAHTHPFQVSTQPGTEHAPGTSLFAALPATGGYEMYAPPSSPLTALGPANLTSAGAGAAYNITSPYIGLQVCICVTNGIYPPRP